MTLLAALTSPTPGRSPAQELRDVGAADAVNKLASRAADHTNLNDPRAVTAVLGMLSRAEAADGVTALLARDSADQADLGDPGAVAALLAVLNLVGAADAVTALLDRAPVGHADLGDSRAVAALLADTAGKPVMRELDVSSASEDWQRAIRDRQRPGMFVRRHLGAC